ncbi:MAG: rhodanese-like domain-containing protein [Burkholderiales bacterium]
MSWWRLIGFSLALLGAMPARAEVVHVGNQELRRLMAQGVALIDIRTAPEWAETGVVKGSHRITFFDEKGRHNAPAWLAQIEEIAKPGQPIAVICRSGNRTLPVSRFLAESGKYPTVYNVRDGTRGWMKEGLPMERLVVR